MDALLPLIMRTIDWLAHKVPLSLRRLSSHTGGRAQDRATRLQQQKSQWSHRVQSGRSGRGTGGRYGNCYPRTMLTHCQKLWCDFRPCTLSQPLLANQRQDQTPPMTITPYPYPFPFYFCCPLIHSLTDFLLSMNIMCCPAT